MQYHWVFLMIMKLRYKIISYSSEDPQAPISNLISNSGFWETSRFCDYPQQITLQFYEPVVISDFAIVSHPSKIASRIIILFCLPDRNQPNEGYKFEKYGYVQLSKNEATNLRCRQCKKINNVNKNALYMRLIFWKNHQNSQNFFNQVGLSKIDIFGSSYIASSLPTLHNRSLLHSLSPNQYIQTKLQLLEQFKTQFAKSDDFQSAKQIKQIIKVIKLQGQRIKQLDIEKKKAISQQFFDRAKKIKQEIDVIKSDIDYMSNNFYDPNKKLIKPVLTDSKLKIKVEQLLGQSSLNSSPQNSRINAFKKDLYNQNDIQQAKSQNQYSENEDQDQDNQQHITQNSRVTYENRVLPAILHKNRKDFQQLLKTGQNLEDAAYQDNQFIQKYEKHDEQEAPEELNPADEANASVAIQIFGKQKIKKIYSKHWNHKLQGISEINEDCSSVFSSKDNDKNTIKAGIFIFNKCIKEGSFPILSPTIDMMNKLLQCSRSKDQILMTQIRNQLHNDLQKSISQFFVKMAENQKVKQTSDIVIKNMLKTQLYGINFLYHTIHKIYNNPTFATSSKIKKYKLGAIQTMLLQCGMGGKNGLPMNSIQFISRVAQDPNGDVRKQATHLLKLMKQRGGGEKVIEAVRNRQSIKGSILKQLQR